MTIVFIDDRTSQDINTLNDMLMGGLVILKCYLRKQETKIFSNDLSTIEMTLSLSNMSC